MRYRKRRINYNKLLKNKCKRKQYKIHAKQMSKYDLEYLADKIREIDLGSTKISWHVINKNDKRLNIELFMDVLMRNYSNLENNIVEYSEIPIQTKYGRTIDKRVLIRDTYDFNGYNICFVLSLTQNSIVTAYWIEKDFAHEDTLNWKRYNPTFYISV